VALWCARARGANVSDIEQARTNAAILFISPRFNCAAISRAGDSVANFPTEVWLAQEPIVRHQNP